MVRRTKKNLNLCKIKIFQPPWDHLFISQEWSTKYKVERTDTHTNQHPFLPIESASKVDDLIGKTDWSLTAGN